MTATSELSPRARRREALIDEILDAAWASCRENGLASLSLRDLASRVDMRAPSLYSYFDSKDAIYDGMFRQAQEHFAEHMRPHEQKREPSVAAIRAATHASFSFCVEDPVRYQLMFQRTLPGFEPSPESYAVAIERLDALETQLRGIGIDDPAAVDMFTALFTGLTSQQVSNDQGGDRWVRLVDDALDMFLRHHNIPIEGEDNS